MNASETIPPEQVRDRIKEFRRVKASELQPNPNNWRIHPQQQRDALRTLLSEIGYADTLLARERADGTLELIDGHLRAEMTPQQEVPVLVLDVDEQEAKQLLATLDPLAGLAESDDEQLQRLLDDCDINSGPLRQMFETFDTATGPNSSDDDSTAPDQRDQLEVKFQILIDCDDEAQQCQLLERLSAEGFACRALIA